jgi:hypothetical protein
LHFAGKRKGFVSDVRESLGLGGFPERGGAAALAEAKDAFTGGTDVSFDAGVFDLFQNSAGVADEREKAAFHFGWRQGRKIEVPELEVEIHEGNAVGVNVKLRTELADDPDFRFFVELRATKDHLLFGAEFMTGKNARAMKAKEDGACGLGENPPVEIAADQEDGDLFRDAAAAAHNLLWHA